MSIDKILRAYRAQCGLERRRVICSSVRVSPYRSARQAAPVRSLAHAISVPVTRVRVMRRWWAHRSKEQNRTLVSKWDVAGALFGYWTDQCWVCGLSIALVTFGLLMAWMEGRAVLRARVLDRHQRMRTALYFKFFGHYPASS